MILNPKTLKGLIRFKKECLESKLNEITDVDSMIKEATDHLKDLFYYVSSEIITPEEAIREILNLDHKIYRRFKLKDKQSVTNAIWKLLTEIENLK